MSACKIAALFYVWNFGMDPSQVLLRNGCPTTWVVVIPAFSAILRSHQAPILPRASAPASLSGASPAPPGLVPELMRVMPIRPLRRTPETECLQWFLLLHSAQLR